MNKAFFDQLASSFKKENITKKEKKPAFMQKEEIKDLTAKIAYITDQGIVMVQFSE